MNSEESRTASRLVLGTAPRGMPSGLANNTGQPDFEAAGSIVRRAAAQAAGQRGDDLCFPPPV
jgi:hypothetical protein